jgi:hypothetical protein
LRRPIIKGKADRKINLKIDQPVRHGLELKGLELQKRLRQKRSSAYMDSLKKIDTAGVTCSRSQIEDLKDAIQTEFPDLAIYQHPVGIIAKCYLGGTYQVHTFDLSNNIVKHYKRGEPLPPLMERGRSLAMHPRYDFIEIYTDTLRAVSLDGDVSFIKG